MFCHYTKSVNTKPRVTDKSDFDSEEYSFSHLTDEDIETLFQGQTVSSRTWILKGNMAPGKKY